MHNCYLNTGVPYGREYCQDVYDHDASWGKKQFWDCLFELGLVQAQEYCDDMYGKEPDI